MSRLVYLSEEDIATLEAVADRISFFGHKTDALLLHGLIEEQG